MGDIPFLPSRLPVFTPASLAVRVRSGSLCAQMALSPLHLSGPGGGEAAYWSGGGVGGVWQAAGGKSPSLGKRRPTGNNSTSKCCRQQWLLGPTGAAGLRPAGTLPP